MEQVFFTAAIICFALAAVAAIVAVVVFVRGDVMNAVRYLRHKPVKVRYAEKRARGRVKMSPPSGAGRGAAPFADTAADGMADGIDRATDDIDSKTAVVGEPQVPLPDAEFATDVLDGDVTENPTDILDDDDSECPTGILGEEESEHPTRMLQEEDSELPTTILGEEESEQPTMVLDTEESEQPTSVLDDGSFEELTSVFMGGSVESVVQQEESSFRFILKLDEVVVHTEEVIE